MSTSKVVMQKMSDDPVSSQEKASNENAVATNERGEWGGQLEFLLTCIGYAVGLGNVWRFPYMCYKNGGGAFLIPYFTMLALVGMPLFFLELSFGQFASLGPTAIWSVSPIFKGLGYAMVITNTLIALYYCIIIGWSMFYLFASMTTQLPWEHCGNWWNTPLCFESKDLFNSTGNITVGNITIPREMTKTPSEEYYYNKVLRQSSGIDDTGDVRWDIAACVFLCWVIVYLVLIKGISSLGKVVYFTSTFPYVLLTVMLIRGVTLDGAIDGILYYLKPDFSRLMDAQVWTDAATQIFYNLSACSGGLIAMASYNKFKNNCLRDSIIVPIINALTSFYAGFVIFSVLGFMAKQKGVSIDDVAASGPGLVFVVYPEALSQMPIAPLWAMLFFLMLLTLGFSSQFSMVECFFASLTDEFPDVLRKNRTRQVIMRVGCILLFFVISYPMVTDSGLYWFNLVDSYVGGFPLLFIGLFETVALNHVYGYKHFADDIYMMLGRKPHKYFRICWCFISPGILLFLIVFMAIQYEPLTLFGSYKYPSWSQAIGWLIVLFPLGFIPIIFVMRLLLNGGWQIMKDASKPLPAWGPALMENREGRYSKQVTGERKEMLQDVSSFDLDTTLNGKLTNVNSFTGGVTNHAFNTSAL